MMEFEPGQLVTCDWARRKRREEAPIFILLAKRYPGRRVEAYCMYDPTHTGWFGHTLTLAIDAIIHFNPQQ